MSIHRIAALGASIMVLTAGALTGSTAGAAGLAAPSGRAAGMVAVSIDRATQQLEEATEQSRKSG